MRLLEEDKCSEALSTLINTSHADEIISIDCLKMTKMLTSMLAAATIFACSLLSSPPPVFATDVDDAVITTTENQAKDIVAGVHVPSGQQQEQVQEKEPNDVQKVVVSEDMHAAEDTLATNQEDRTLTSSESPSNVATSTDTNNEQQKEETNLNEATMAEVIVAKVSPAEDMKEEVVIAAADDQSNKKESTKVGINSGESSSEQENDKNSENQETDELVAEISTPTKLDADKEDADKEVITIPPAPKDFKEGSDKDRREMASISEDKSTSTTTTATIGDEEKKSITDSETQNEQGIEKNEFLAKNPPPSPESNADKPTVTKTSHVSVNKEAEISTSPTPSTETDQQTATQLGSSPPPTTTKVDGAVVVVNNDNNDKKKIQQQLSFNNKKNPNAFEVTKEERDLEEDEYVHGELSAEQIAWLRKH